MSYTISMKKYICILLLLLCSCSKNTSFIGKHYIRYTDYGIENICFLENGQFSYYDDAGEPVDDSDLINSYTYDSDTQCITLSDNTVIKVIKSNRNELILDFNGEKRIFKLE